VREQFSCVCCSNNKNAFCQGSSRCCARQRWELFWIEIRITLVLCSIFFKAKRTAALHILGAIGCRVGLLWRDRSFDKEQLNVQRLAIVRTNQGEDRRQRLRANAIAAAEEAIFREHAAELDATARAIFEMLSLSLTLLLPVEPVDLGKNKKPSTDGVGTSGSHRTRNV
jgi:hypothetical protein